MLHLLKVHFADPPSCQLAPSQATIPTTGVTIETNFLSYLDQGSVVGRYIDICCRIKYNHSDVGATAVTSPEDKGGGSGTSFCQPNTTTPNQPCGTGIMTQDIGEQRLPIPISVIQNKYLLFDVQAIAWLRKTYHICGVFIGTLPQNPSQNVFMGLPMEIMPEEAQLLTELGIGYILDDAQAHDAALAMSDRTRKVDYVREIDEQAREISSAKAVGKETDRKRALKKVKGKQARTDSSTPSVNATPGNDKDSAAGGIDNSESLFGQPEETESPTPTRSTTKRHAGAILSTQNDVTITPTTSTTLLPAPQPTTPTSSLRLLPGLSSSSFNLYRHLNTLHYFQTPGLRFGCQFCVYPGDPLRFHSHFLAVATDWEDEIDLMNIVGGGRLGTGVKKGYLLGGKDPVKDEMRTFSVEWAAM